MAVILNNTPLKNNPTLTIQKRNNAQCKMLLDNKFYHTYWNLISLSVITFTG